MSTYYDMSISSTTWNEIYDTILTAIKEEDNTWQIVELVHLLDYWEELKEESATKNNKEFKKWLEQQKLFEKREVEDIFLYHKIKNVLDKNSVEKDVESEFHLVCDLAEMFEKEWRERDENTNNEQEDKSDCT